MLSALVLLLLQLAAHSNHLKADDNLSTVNLIQKNTADVLRLRGYLAQEFNYTTSEGYILNLIRANNPLINNGLPGGLANKSIVLFVSGATSSGRSYLINSVLAQPRNYGHLSAAKMSDRELLDLLANDTTTNSLGLTLLNFGHEIWIMNRRGTFASQGHTDKLKQAFNNPLEALSKYLFGGSPLWPLLRNKRKRQVNPEQLGGPLDAPVRWLSLLRVGTDQVERTINSKYWDYSLDEQAAYDLPEVVDFVLGQTGRKKISILGYSASGGIALMSLADKRLSKDKILKMVLWAPAMDLGRKQRDSDLTLATVAPILEPVLINFLGPFVPTFLAPFIRMGNSALCGLSAYFKSICEQYLLSYAAGYGGDQQKFYPGYSNDLFDAVSMREITQMLQAANKRAMHHFDYRSMDKNMAAYGKPDPPIYQLEDIDFPNITIFYANTDALITPFDVKQMLTRFRVPVESHLIDGPNVIFNHFSFVIHKNVSTLSVIPNLKVFEQADSLE